MNCDVPKQYIDRDKCFAQWPNFPCYDPKQKACHSTSGVQLLDPVGDIIYSATRAYTAGYDLISSLMGIKPPRLRRQSDRDLDERLYGYATTTFPVKTNIPLMKISETGPLAQRFLNPNEIKNYKKKGEYVINIIKNTLKTKRKKTKGGYRRRKRIKTRKNVR